MIYQKQKAMTHEQKVSDILEVAKQMVLAGTLLKNVKRHFTNLGVNSELADKICKIAEFEANDWQSQKAK